MTPEDRSRIFRKLAPKVYGRYWKNNICLHLNISSRTVFNWLQGKTFPDVRTVRLLFIYAHYGYTYDRQYNKVKLVKKNAVSVTKS